MMHYEPIISPHAHYLFSDKGKGILPKKAEKKSEYFLQDTIDTLIADYLVVQIGENNNLIPVFLNDKLVGSLPHKLDYLCGVIEKSKKILLHEQDWDSEGGEAYSEVTWMKAIDFLIRYSTALVAKLNVLIEVPYIYEGPQGSIDILWEKQGWRVLINIAKGGEHGMFYSDDLLNQRSEGFFSPNNFNLSLLPIPKMI